MSFRGKIQPPLTKNFKRSKNESLQIYHHSDDRPAGHFLRTKLGTVPGSWYLSLSCCLLRFGTHRMGIRLWDRILKWCRLSLWNDGWCSLRNEAWLSVRYDNKRFFSLCLRSKRQSFSYHMKRKEFQRTKGHFVTTVIRWKISKSDHFKRKDHFLRLMYWFWFRKDYHPLEQFRTI